MKKKRNINDIILIAVLVLIPLVMLVLGNSRDTATEDAMVVITIDGAPYKTIPLDADSEFTVTTEEGTNYIIVNDGKVRVSEADCPDKVCVDHSSISKDGEQIVCLPHKLVIEIANGSDSEIDTLSQ